MLGEVSISNWSHLILVERGILAFKWFTWRWLAFYRRLTSPLRRMRWLIWWKKHDLRTDSCKLITKAFEKSDHIVRFLIFLNYFQCTTITRFEQEPDESGRKFNQRCNRCHLEKNVRKDHSRLRTLYRSRGCYKLLKRNQPRKHHSVSISPKQDMMEQCSVQL